MSKYRVPDFLLKTRLQFRALQLDKVLRLTVAGVMDNREVEPQTKVDVSRPGLRQGPSGKTRGGPKYARNA
jgi:hypothetical protein